MIYPYVYFFSQAIKQEYQELELKHLNKQTNRKLLSFSQSIANKPKLQFKQVVKPSYLGKKKFEIPLTTCYDSPQQFNIEKKNYLFNIYQKTNQKKWLQRNLHWCHIVHHAFRQTTIRDKGCQKYV